MDRTDPDFRWSHQLPDGTIVSNLNANRDQLLQVILDLHAEYGRRLARVHGMHIAARDLHVQIQMNAGKWPTL